MKYNLCKNSISLMSQKNGQTARQIKVVLKAAPVEPKDCTSTSPEAQPNSPEEQEAQENREESQHDTEEVDVGCDGPVNDDNESVAKSNATTEGENMECDEEKDLPRQSAFSAVTPNNDGAEVFKPPVPHAEDSQNRIPTFNHPGFTWGPIPPPIPLKPLPPLMVHDYTPYHLPDRPMYPPYYLTGNHAMSEPNPPTYPTEFLKHQRAVVQQPIPAPHTAPFPPFPTYPYRYCHPLHPGPPLHYTLYRPHEIPMPIGPRYLPLDLYGPTLGPKDYDLYMHSHPTDNHPQTSPTEDSHHGQSGDKGTRLSPKAGSSALGSPDRPSQGHVIQRDTEVPQFTQMSESHTPQQGHTPVSAQLLKNDLREEVSEEMLLPLDEGSSQHRQYSSAYESSPDSQSQQDYMDNMDGLVPLNLSTRKNDKARQPDQAPRDCDMERLKENEVPLNLSVRAPYSSPLHSSALSEAADELKEEPCDQRQTAALALCQLAIASSAASSCDLGRVGRPSNDTASAASKQNTMKRSGVKGRGLKRARGGHGESKYHKPSKRAKAHGRALRKRPRCS